MTTPCTKEGEIAMIDERTRIMEKQINEIHKYVVGDNGEGIRAKVKTALVQLKFQWGILALIFVWLVLKNVVL